jgi:Tripartite tricarboxylate transporter TctB family
LAGITGRSQLRPLVELAIWLALVIGMWVYSYQFDRKLQSYAFGPVAWPRAVLLFIALAAVIACAADWRRNRATEARSAADSVPTPRTPTRLGANLRLLAAFTLPLLYVWLLPHAGYFATTPFFLAASMRTLGLTRWPLVIGLSLAIYALMLLLFSKLLFIPLPTGNWPGFYDFSNWLLIRLGSG